MLGFRASVFSNEVVVLLIILNLDKKRPDRLGGRIRERQEWLERNPGARELGSFGFQSANELRWFWKIPQAKSFFMARVKTPGRLFAVIKEGEHARGGKRIVCGQLRQIHLRYEGKIASSPLRPRNVRRKVRQATEL